MKKDNESFTLASYKIAYVLAKRGKPLTDGNMIKDCIMEAVTEICPEKINIFKMVSLAPNTIDRRVEHIGNNILKQTINKAQCFNWYSLALDESTDISNTAQRSIFPWR